MESLRNIEQKTHISFEPFSANILQKVNEARGIKEKNAIFESVFQNDKALTLNEVNGFITTLYQNHRGTNKTTWNVLKLKNMDGGLFLEVLKYIKRNEERRGYHYGDILLQNKYGKTVLISRSDIRTNRFIRKIKGFL